MGHEFMTLIYRKWSRSSQIHDIRLVGVKKNYLKLISNYAYNMFSMTMDHKHRENFDLKKDVKQFVNILEKWFPLQGERAHSL